MASQPQIPNRYSSLHSLIPPSSRETISRLAHRSTSAASAFSQLSVASSVDDFINAKIERLSAEIALNHEYKAIFDNAKKRKELSIDHELEATRKELQSDIVQQEKELLVLKRQKKGISDDVAECLPNHSDTEDAYASIITSKIMSASNVTRTRAKFDQSKYSEGVLNFYGAIRGRGTLDVEKYCHLTGWQPAKLVKCAHLVPKSLESDDLAYLFGDRESILSEPRNGITLNCTIEGGLDSGWIVLVPDKMKGDEEIVWRCILTDKSRASKTVSTGITWGDIDGKVLKFLTSNRPARRYLYLRYVITYLFQEKNNNIKWVDGVESKGFLWATPGPYLRKSMLLTLAARASDVFLPELFYSTTFEAKDNSQRSQEEEDDLAMSLDHKIQDEMAAVRHDRERESDSDESGIDED